MKIHPAAIIDPSAELHETVEVGAYSVIGKNVKIGKNSIIMNSVNLMDNTEIGENNQIHIGAVIGHTPQHLGYTPCLSKTIIGNDNIIREYATIHKGLKEGSATIIGNGNFIMGVSHIGHDVKIGDGNTIANYSALAGHVEFGNYNFISGFSGVHQFTRVGDYIMISGMTRVGKDVPPYVILEGYCEVRGINVVGLRRRGFTSEQRREIMKIYKLFYRSGLNVKHAIEEIKRHTWTEVGQRFLDFVSTPTKRGLARHHKITGKHSEQEEEISE